MNTDAIEIGRTYIHIRTGVRYVAQEKLLCKVADGEWTPSVVYVQDGTGVRFCRDAVAFGQNFRPGE